MVDRNYSILNMFAYSANLKINFASKFNLAKLNRVRVDLN